MIIRLSTVLITAIATPLYAVDFRIIIDRDPAAVELFIQIPAPLIPEHIGTFPAEFMADDGIIDIAPFQNGTFDQGDYIFRNVTAMVDGRPIQFESMSMMVHPPEFDVTFDDPIDALKAISVCNVPDPLARFHVDDLMGYLGYIAYPVDGYAPITFAFPTNSKITVMEYRDGSLTSETDISSAMNGIVNLPENRPSQSWFKWLWD